MSREVTVDELRESLEEIIAEVEAGQEVMIVPEKRNGVTIVQRGRRFPFRDFVPGPRPKNLNTNAVDLIREDRDSEFEKYK
jgi:antitoxin (DNA-binding transcriptional repressor) of toxin-antitoxin stability system